MRQTLTLRTSQQLVMTPQLRQAIRLIQLSGLELRQEVQEAVESNPMLEVVEDDEAPVDAEAFADGLPQREANVADTEDAPWQTEQEPSKDAPAFDDEAAPGEELAGADGYADLAGAAPEPLGAFDEPGGRAEAADGERDTPPEEMPVEVTGEDVYQPSRSPAPTGTADPDGLGFEERNSAPQSLVDHLLWQLNLTRLSGRDRMAALVVVDAVDADGMLTASAEELLSALDPALGYAPEEVELAVKRVQSLDPPGVGARDLAECLLLQLAELDEATPWREAAIRLVRDHFSLLAARDRTALARRMRLDNSALDAAIALIRSLSPRPGAAIGDPDIEYVEPDVVVTRQGGRWTVSLNREAQPKLRVNETYAKLVHAADGADAAYLRDNLQNARFFLKNLEYRSDTLLQVAAEIVARQRGFLEHGEEAMQPLVLADIASAVDRHESTISRVTTRKYMATPRGVFELKYFFSSHVCTAAGGEVSSTAIRAQIKKLTSEENPRKPLSDNKITALLKERGVKVARRTVAKYRESLAIPSSTERRRLV